MLSRKLQLQFDQGNTGNAKRRISKRIGRVDRNGKKANATPASPNADQARIEQIDSLQRQLREQETQLQAARDHAAQSTAELQQFVGAVSHDLRTPLRAVTGFSEFLRQEYENQLDDTAGEYIGRILGGAERMQKIINSLTSYSRVFSSAAPCGDTDLNEVFECAVAKLPDLIEDSEAVVTHDLLPLVVGDQAQLILLLRHLIENSIRFRGSAAPRIHVSTNRIDNVWTIEVEDNGIGIQEQHQDCVFEMFRRLQYQQGDHGIGAGLAICRRIVERQGGNIWLKSKPGTGTSVYFSIAASE